jgi:hypothetical protein
MGDPRAPLPKRRPSGTSEDTPKAGSGPSLGGVPVSPDHAERLAAERVAAERLAAAGCPAKPGDAKPHGEPPW